MFFSLFAFVTFITAVQGACPNKCSGHGTCGLGEVCQCQPRWVGPDCSGRECAYGLSFVTTSDVREAPAGAYKPSDDSVNYHGRTSAVGSETDGATTVTLSTDFGNGASATNNMYNGMTISFLGASSEKSGVITGYTGATKAAVISPNVGAVPAGTSYTISPNFNFNDIGHHAYTECSSKGSCDRAIGECQCFPGYSGRGCRRHQCPNDCSGHGRCRYNFEMNPNYSPEGVDGETNEFHSQNWDYNKARQCDCDRGFQGYDCSQRMCPKGDDPLTNCGEGEGEIADIQQLTFAQVSTGENDEHFFTLTFQDMFNGNYTTKPIQIARHGQAASVYQAVATDIQTALMDLPNFAAPNVTVSHAGTGYSNNYYVTFVDEANSGKQNLLVCSETSAGNVLYNYADVNPRFVEPTNAVGAQTLCTATSETDTLYFNTDVGAKRYGEHIECSNRGACDYTTGLCGCYDGYTGEACSTQTVFF